MADNTVKRDTTNAVQQSEHQTADMGRQSNLFDLLSKSDSNGMTGNNNNQSNRADVMKKYLVYMELPKIRIGDYKKSSCVSGNVIRFHFLLQIALDEENNVLRLKPIRSYKAPVVNFAVIHRPFLDDVDAKGPIPKSPGVRSPLIRYSNDEDAPTSGGPDTRTDDLVEDFRSQNPVRTDDNRMPESDRLQEAEQPIQLQSSQKISDNSDPSQSYASSKQQDQETPPNQLRSSQKILDQSEPKRPSQSYDSLKRQDQETPPNQLRSSQKILDQSEPKRPSQSFDGSKQQDQEKKPDYQLQSSEKNFDQSDSKLTTQSGGPEQNDQEDKRQISQPQRVQQEIDDNDKLFEVESAMRDQFVSPTMLSDDNTTAHTDYSASLPSKQRRPKKYFVYCELPKVLIGDYRNSSVVCSEIIHAHFLMKIALDEVYGQPQLQPVKRYHRPKVNFAVIHRSLIVDDEAIGPIPRSPNVKSPMIKEEEIIVRSAPKTKVIDDVLHATMGFCYDRLPRSKYELVSQWSLVPGANGDRYPELVLSKADF